MNILIIGNGNSFWIRDYIKYILISDKIKVFLVTKTVTDSSFRMFYEKNNVTIIDTNQGAGVFDCIYGLKTLINMKKKIRKLSKQISIDVIHVHGVPSNFLVIFIGFSIIKYAKTIVTTFWGSDLLAKTTKQLTKCKLLIKKSKYVTVSTKEMKNVFAQKFDNEFNEKIVQIKFGVSIIDEIKILQKKWTKDDCKKKLGISTRKITIAVGYNARERQHHIDIIDQLAKLEEKSKFHLILQLSYGRDSIEYIERVIDTVKASGFEYSLIEEFLDGKTSAILRLATDIFIHGQDSDAFSASVQENLYAGAYLINPKWIQYTELKDWGINYVEYECFEQITNLVYDILEGNIYKSGKEQLKRLAKESSWDALKPSWLDLYNLKGD